MNTNLHLGPLVCLLVELYYNNFTFPKRHLWVLALYGTGYLMINLGNSIIKFSLLIGCKSNLPTNRLEKHPFLFSCHRLLFVCCWCPLLRKIFLPKMESP